MIMLCFGSLVIIIGYSTSWFSQYTFDPSMFIEHYFGFWIGSTTSSTDWFGQYIFSLSMSTICFSFLINSTGY